MCAQVLQVVLSIRQLSPRLEFFRTQAAATEISPVSPSAVLFQGTPCPGHAERLDLGLCDMYDLQQSRFRGSIAQRKLVSNRWDRMDI